MIQGSLFCLWMHKSSQNNQNLQLQSKESLLKADDSTAKLTGTGSTWGIEPGVLNR